MKRAGALISLLVAVASTLAGCAVPDNERLMEWNRNGRWKEAERVGQDMLARRDRFTHSQTCETYFHVVYAETRMGKKGDAARLMKEYDDFSVREPIDPKLRWLGREMAMLKDELGLLDGTQRALLSAMVENEKGNHSRARELCEGLLSMSGASEAQKASAHFVAAVCSIRLKDAEKAEAHLAAFDSLKSALPPDHEALADERAAREGLAELKKR